MFGGLALALGTAVISNKAAKKRNDAQIDQANAQMGFQADMSNSSYQRAVADMKAAGLNPMLAYSQGGASTPSGSMADIQDTLTPAVNTANQVFKEQNNASVARASVDNIRTDTGLKEANTLKTQADTELSRTQAELNLIQAEREKSQIGVNTAQTAFLGANKDFIVAQITKVAPEIKKMVSQANLNDAQKQRVLAELPLIAARVGLTTSETDLNNEKRFLTGVQTMLETLKVNEARASSEMYETAYGRALPYVNSGAKAIGDVTGGLTPWAFLFKDAPKRFGK